MNRIDRKGRYSGFLSHFFNKVFTPSTWFKSSPHLNLHQVNGDTVIMSDNPHYHSPPAATQMPKREPIVKTWQKPKPWLSDELKALYSQPYMRATTMYNPPNIGLVEAGEKAMRELGLVSAKCPRIHINPFRTPPGSWHKPGSREWSASKAAGYRKQAQKHAYMADE